MPGRDNERFARPGKSATPRLSQEREQTGMRFTVDRIDHIVLNVKDVEITSAWYQRVLGMERTNLHKRIRALGLVRGR